MTKALAGLAVAPAAAVLGSDTAVVIAGRILGKPKDRAAGLEMLSMLSGATHRVLTGVAVATTEDVRERMSVTTVTFRTITPEEQSRYWGTGEPADKAGAYAIQGLGAQFVKAIDGSYSGVVGLPLFETAELLRLTGFELLSDSDAGRNTD